MSTRLKQCGNTGAPVAKLPYHLQREEKPPFGLGEMPVGPPLRRSNR